MNDDTTTAPATRDPWAMIGVWLTVGLLFVSLLANIALWGTTTSLRTSLNAMNLAIGDLNYRTSLVEQAQSNRAAGDQPVARSEAR